jgi:hypothetical protein
MLFGSSRKAFGASNIMPGDQPAIPQLPTGVMDPGAASAPTASGDKVNWWGVLADALAGAAGRPGMYAAQMDRDHQQRLLLAQDQRKRSLDMTDWQAKQEWERAHPTPVNNDTINDFNWFKGLSEPDRQIYQQMHPQYRQGPDGQFYPIQVAPTAPAGGSLPSFTADDWDKAGGPTQPASGGFHRRPAG